MGELTITWEDPAETAGQGRELGGLAYMEAIRDGRLPRAPIQHLLGFALVEVAEGRVAFRVEPGEQHFNPMNSVHGGLAMTLLDSACGACVHTTLEAGQFYGSLETKVNFVRQITAESGPLLAHGEVIYRGGKVATSEGRLVGEGDGTLYAHGTSTCLILG
jgi:uncharacterized protein (TIGR00369 family)